MEKKFSLRRNHVGTVLFFIFGLFTLIVAVFGYLGVDFDFSSILDNPLFIFVPLGYLVILALGLMCFYFGIIGTLSLIRYPENELVITDAGIYMPGQYGKGRVFYPFSSMIGYRLARVRELVGVEITLTNGRVTILSNFFFNSGDYEYTKKVIEAKVPAA